MPHAATVEFLYQFDGYARSEQSPPVSQDDDDVFALPRSPFTPRPLAASLDRQALLARAE